jgi:hypothetical protein
MEFNADKYALRIIIQFNNGHEVEALRDTLAQLDKEAAAIAAQILADAIFAGTHYLLNTPHRAAKVDVVYEGGNQPENRKRLILKL